MSLINIERTIELDVYDHDTTPSVIKAIQLDEGTRAVYAVIQNSRQGYDIGQNAEVKLTVLRPDKTRVQITGQTFGYSGADGTIYGAKAELSDVALAVKGNLKAQFKIASGEQELRTEIFTINTGEALDAGDGDWAGDLDGHNLDEMAESIETLQTDMAAVNEDVSDLKEGLSELVPTESTLENVGYIKTNVDTISTTPTVPGSGGWRYIILECQQGDKFTVYGQYLGTAADLYTFVDTNYNVLERSVDKSEDEYYYPVAPENSAYVVFQKNNAHPNRFWSGVSIDYKIKTIDGRVDAIQDQVDNLDVQPFPQNIDGWVNKGIAPSTGAITANAKRLMADISYTALSCYVDTGYSFLVFGWDNDTYLGWYDGTEFVKTTMVPKTTELDISSIASYTLRAILIHGTTTAGAVNIDPSEGIHFYTKNKTDSLFNTKNAPADAYSVGESLTAIKNESDVTIKNITDNEFISPDTSGYIKTNVSPVNVSDITQSTNILCGVYPCEPLEWFTVKGADVGASASYCVFLDSSYNVLRREGQHSEYAFVQAPSNSSYVVFHTDPIYTPNVFVRGKLVAKAIAELSEQMDDLDGIIGGYLSTSYYEASDTQTVVTSYDTLISMYDALVSANPNYITKNALTHGDFTNYEYVFGMGDRNGGNGQRAKDTSFGKPLVLIMAGTHGHERCSIMGLYLFAKALCESPELSPLRNGLTIKMIPVVCPSGYNNNSRVNANGVNINRNFNANWVLTPDDGMNYSGASPADQDETQVVQDWMNANTDAVIEIDWHNSAYTNEICYFATCIADGFAVNAKKGYFYGLDRITSHWINDRGITDSTTIYGYTGVDHANGTSYAYAQSINLKGCLYETSWNVGSYGKDTTETIGVNAEAFCAFMKGILEKYIDVL